jgi:uncharacterized protein
MKRFEPHPWLRNPHVATLVAAFWPRNFSRLPRATQRLFETEPGTRLLARCHWHPYPRRHPVLVLVHGLEGSSESRYVLGIAAKAYAAGFSVLRMNQRTCGASERLTATLYHSGLSADYRAVLEELIEKDGLSEIFFAGYSMGGNLVLKMAGELGSQAPKELRGVCAICPGLDLATASDATAEPRNRLYQWHFLHHLRRRLRRKAKLVPRRYRTAGLSRLKTLRQWDEIITAPAFGFGGAADYYERSSALRVAGQIQVPTLILAAQDDPIVPVSSIREPRIAGNPFITLVTPECGGHCGFVSRHSGNERFWAEPRIVEFCSQHSKITAGISAGTAAGH